MDCAHGFRLVSVKGQRSSVTEQADFRRVGSVLTHRYGLYRKCRGSRQGNEAFHSLRGDLGCGETSGFPMPKSGQGGTGRSGSRLRDRHRISNRSSGWFLLLRCYRGYVNIIVVERQVYHRSVQSCISMIYVRNMHTTTEHAT